MTSLTIFTRALAALTLTSTVAVAGDSYTYVDLGTLGGDASGALGVNDLGQVVGWSTIPGCTTTNGLPCRRAFLWDNGTMIDLGLLSGDEGSAARAINNAGVIVGNSERDVIAASGTYHAVIWTSVGPPTPLTDLGQGTSWANDINEAGTAVGYATDPASQRDRVVTWQSGSITNLGASEPHSYNRGLGISNNGNVVGMAWNLFSPNDSIAYDGSWSQIGGFGQFENSEAYDLNDAGLAVGTQAFPSGNWHASMWELGQAGATDLGVLPGHSLAYLLDVNDAGLAVGYSLDESGPVETRAIFTDGTTLTNLNDLLPPGTNALLWDAMEINEHGDIVGTAVVDGNFRAYMLQVGEPAPGTAFCFGDGSGTACPCSNDSALPEAGCVHSQGIGMRITGSGSTSIAADDLTLRAEDCPVSNSGIFYSGKTSLAPGNQLYDGLQCAGGDVRRYQGQFQANGSVSDTGFVAQDPSGVYFVAGVTYYFQYWTRDVASGGSTCGTGANFSPAYGVQMTP